MKTKTKKKLIYQIAPEFELTETASLAELRAKKKKWLQEGIDTGILADCRLIAIELGERFEDELRYPWSQRPAYRWRDGEIEIRLYCDLGDQYLVYQNCREEKDRVVVIVNGHMVARYVFTNNPQADLSECFYVPGKWTLTVQAEGITAGEHEASRIFDQQETERQKLLEQLLVGVEV